MDSSSPVTHIGLCAGYGGIELGLHRAIRGMRTVALCEIEAFAIANLVAKMEAGLMDPAPIWPDLKTFPWAAFRDRVDILTGGYPCQPFSAAGKRAGKEDPRHLWPWIADGIRLLRPRCCFFENVEGHISLGLSDVIEDLAGMGYRTTWGIFSAAECGAPHQRKRVFILAHNDSERSQELARQVSAQSNTPPLGTFVLLANSSSQRSPARLPEQESRYERQSGITQHGSCEAWPSRPGEQQYGWEPPRVVADAKESGQRERQEDLGCPQSDRPSEAMGNTNHGRQPSGIDTGSCTEAYGGGQGDVEQADGGMGDSWSGTRLGSTQGTAGHAVQSDKELGDSQSGNGEGKQVHLRQGQGEHRGASGSECEGRRKAEPPLGRNADGPSGGMDYAELCVSGDNRTDELRLLGNGVVPATAERAFVSLMRELDSNQAGS